MAEQDQGPAIVDGLEWCRVQLVDAREALDALEDQTIQIAVALRGLVRACLARDKAEPAALAWYRDALRAARQLFPEYADPAGR